MYIRKQVKEMVLCMGSLEKTEKKLKNNEKLAAHGIEI